MLTQKANVTSRKHTKEALPTYSQKLVLIKNDGKISNTCVMEENLYNTGCNLNFWGMGPREDELKF
ncbi:MAG: hypothetical protein JJT76_18650 [Clostridiaceae bacterium]|nr:hypothetical protein [Clostridiaceae bacterium]